MSDVPRTGITINTPDRLVLGPGVVYKNFVSYAVPGTLLGATRDGATWELTRTIREIPLDGARGPVSQLRRLLRVEAKLTARLMEITTANLLEGIAGATSAGGLSAQHVTAEAVGVGDGVDFTWNLAHGGAAEVILAVPTRPIVYVANVLQVEGIGANYTIDLGTGLITFNAGSIPILGAVITADYYWDAGAGADHDLITGGEVAAGDFLTNIAMLTSLRGDADPIAFLCKNGLPTATLSFAAPDNDEMGVELTWEAHYSAADLTTEPWEIWRPT